MNSSYDLLFLILLLCLLLLVPYARAQEASTPPPPPPYADFNPSIIAIIVILIAALFLMGFFSIYIRRRSANDEGGSIRRAISIRRPTASRGLDSSIIETFPTFVYSTVKGLKIGKGALECAVCLNEYQDEETLRLIPKCDHVFHPECIDAWFESHVTCPVCRANLVPDSTSSSVVGGVEDDDDDSVPVSVEEPVVNNVQEPEESLNRKFPRLFDKFRSHSTGHSLGENLDRFTLRLPEDVRKQVVNRALLNRVGSTVRMVGEGSGRKGYRMRRKSYKRLESVAVRSERWVLPRAPSFLTRAFSIRSPRGNPDPSTSVTSPNNLDKIPLNNIGPKSC